MTTLQWGRGLGTAERKPRTARWRATATRLQWGRGLGTAESWRATATRKSRRNLQWGRGLGTAERSCLLLPRIPRSTFNGAAVLGPRRVKSMESMLGTLMDLQWGRGLGTAESGLRGAGGSSRRLPFNGARAWGPGAAGSHPVGLVGALGLSVGRRSWDRGERKAVLVHRVAHDPFNGAGVWGPGREYPRHTPLSSTGNLQWGRGLGTAERLAHALRTLRHDRPSMGPRSWDRGGHNIWCCHRRTQHLQWGRGLGTAESATRRIDRERPALASMGPRSWDRGEFAPPALRRARFRASMGPRSWDRGEPAMRRAIMAQQAASMGPRSWDRGEVTVAGRRRHARRCFNGAAVLGPRRVGGGCWSRPAKNRLQWGRGLGTAESSCGGHGKWQMEDASMGPRSWDRGESSMCDVFEDHPTMLQWGRGLGTAESARPPHRSPRRMKSFNGAAVLGPRRARAGEERLRRRDDAWEGGHSWHRGGPRRVSGGLLI